jgi:DNA-binding XRE family transcriptional regulator
MGDLQYRNAVCSKKIIDVADKMEANIEKAKLCYEVEQSFIAEHATKWREHCRATKAEVARFMRVSHASVSFLEQNKMRWTKSLVVSYVRACNLKHSKPSVIPRRGVQRTPRIFNIRKGK